MDSTLVIFDELRSGAQANISPNRRERVVGMSLGRLPTQLGESLPKSNTVTVTTDG
jgi:hypothetical protein